MPSPPDALHDSPAHGCALAPGRGYLSTNVNFIRTLYPATLPFFTFTL